jgi:Zn-dependent protease with chaperone function
VTRLQFNELVEKLEYRFEGRPGALSFSTALWVCGGYLVLFGPLAAALLVGFVTLLAGFWVGQSWSLWPILGGLGIVLWSLWIYRPLIWTSRSRFPEVVVGKHEAPALHAEIEKLRQGIGCHRFHRIILTAEFNAGVVTESRFGMLGGRRSVLQLGLPLMEALTPDEFRAVLAQEFVHHSRAHGRFAIWVYRVRSSWERAIAELSSSDRPGMIMRWARWFIRWYWPRMNARAFLLCREHEYQADDYSAEYAGALPAVSALFRVETFDQYLNLVFWPELNRETEKLPAPPADLLQRMTHCLRTSQIAAVQDWCVETTLLRLTDTADTHPAWADRTFAMGVEPERFSAHGFPSLPSRNAAQEYLEGDRQELTRRVATQWCEFVSANWKAEHRRRNNLRQRLVKLTALTASRPNDVALHWEQATLIKELETPDQLPQVLEPLLTRTPPHRPAVFEMGVFKLNRGDAEGAEYLTRLMDQQRDAYYEPACHALCMYYRLTGRFEEMREMEARLDGRDSWTDWMREGHRRIARRIPCLPHGLTAEQLAALRAELAQESHLKGAWLALAGDQPRGAPPLFLLCVSTSVDAAFFRNREREVQISRGLVGKVVLPGRVLIIVPQGPDRPLARRVMAVPDSLVYDADHQLV